MIKNRALAEGATVVIVAMVVGCGSVESQIVDPGIQKLILRLDNQDPDMRIGAAKELGRLGPKAKDAVPALTRTFQEARGPTRAVIADAIGKIGPDAREAVPVMIEALKTDTHAFSKLGTAMGLAKIGEPAVIELRALLQNEDISIRFSGACGLIAAGKECEKVVPVLAEMLRQSDHNEYIQHFIYTAHMQGGTKVVPAAMLLCHESEPETRKLGIIILQDLKGNAIALLRNLAENDPDTSVRHAAREAIGKIREEEP